MWLSVYLAYTTLDEQNVVDQIDLTIPYQNNNMFNLKLKQAVQNQVWFTVLLPCTKA